MFVRRKSLMFFQLRRSFSRALDYKTDQIFDKNGATNCSQAADVNQHNPLHVQTGSQRTKPQRRSTYLCVKHKGSTVWNLNYLKTKHWKKKTCSFPTKQEKIISFSAWGGWRHHFLSQERAFDNATNSCKLKRLSGAACNLIPAAWEQTTGSNLHENVCHQTSGAAHSVGLIISIQKINTLTL